MRRGASSTASDTPVSCNRGSLQFRAQGQGAATACSHAGRAAGRPPDGRGEGHRPARQQPHQCGRGLRVPGCRREAVCGDRAARLDSDIPLRKPTRRPYGEGSAAAWGPPLRPAGAVASSPHAEFGASGPSCRLTPARLAPQGCLRESNRPSAFVFMKNPGEGLRHRNGGPGSGAAARVPEHAARTDHPFVSVPSCLAESARR
jgi:hypothetical protein